MRKRNILKGIVHVLIIGIILSPTFFLQNPNDLRPGGFFNLAFSAIVLSIFYLTNVFVLIPRFIHKRRYQYYLLGVAGLFFILVLGIFFVNWINPPMEIMNDFRPKPNPQIMPPGDSILFPLGFFFGNFMIRFLMVLGLGTGLELLFLFDSERKRNDEMARQKAISDLNFLKNQLNPHFLLNSLNNIYSLARKKSEETTNAILLLSDLLRHVLYESGKNQISINQEINFINTYINLEKLKFNEENAPNINFKIDIKNPDYPVVPLIMTTLVENAFKHGISYIIPSFILISLVESESDIRFSVINSLQKRDFNLLNGKQKGLGIQNLDKQLQLSYPGKFSFNQRIENNMFKAFLTLKK